MAKINCEAIARNVVYRLTLELDFEDVVVLKADLQNDTAVGEALYEALDRIVERDWPGNEIALKEQLDS